MTEEVYWNRYVAKFEERGPDECWPWTAGTVGRTNHGLFKLFGYGHSAAKAGFRLRYGRYPNGVIRHTCDNGGCQNPAHWLEGSKADNSRDMAVRGRGTAKLTPDEVRSVREEYARGIISGKMLAEVFGMSQSAISKIARGETRRHVI